MFYYSLAISGMIKYRKFHSLKQHYNFKKKSEIVKVISLSDLISSEN